MAVARGVVTHRPEWKGLLSEEGMVQRDGRMVERKKTGLAKARKRVSFGNKRENFFILFVVTDLILVVGC